MDQKQIRDVISAGDSKFVEKPLSESVPLGVSGTGKRFPAMRKASKEEFMKAIVGKDSHDEGIWTDGGATDGGAYWKGTKLLAATVDLGGSHPTEYFVPTVSESKVCEANSLITNMIMSDIGHRLEQGPADFHELLMALDPPELREHEEWLEGILDVLVKGGKLKLQGGKYSIAAKNESFTVSYRDTRGGADKELKEMPAASLDQAKQMAHAFKTIPGADCAYVFAKGNVNAIFHAGDPGKLDEAISDDELKKMSGDDVVAASKKLEYRAAQDLMSRYLKLKAAEKGPQHMPHGFTARIPGGGSMHIDAKHWSEAKNELGEGGLPPGKFWAQKGKTPWGDKPHSKTEVKEDDKCSDCDKPLDADAKEFGKGHCASCAVAADDKRQANEPKEEGCDKMPWQRAKTIATKQGADDPDALAAHIQQKAKGESMEERLRRLIREQEAANLHESETEYVRKGGDMIRGKWSIRAFKTKQGDWGVTEYSAIALNMAEPMGRFPTRAEAVAFADKLADRKESEEKTKHEATESTAFECQECGAKFKKKLGPDTFEVECPKCHSIDVYPIEYFGTKKD